MKLLYKTICCLFLLFIFSFSITAQYVTLQGKQFKNADGSDFYPLVCNYYNELASSDNGATIFLKPGAAYGSGGYDECTDFVSAQTRIQQDFHEIKRMGFNTIRIGAGLSKTSDHFTVTYANNMPYNGNAVVDIYAPYNTNTNLQMLFSQINLVLGYADAESLKVILLTGGGNLVNTDIPPLNVTTGSNQNQHAADYEQLLSAFGDYFKNSTSLLAYDLYNEPLYSDQTYFHKKEDICQWTGEWYNAVKNNDPNHLITIGLSNLLDVMEWDPGVMKLDFLSQHIYPGFSSDDNYNLSSGLDRFHDELVWLSNNSPIPWIIGETSFAASNTANNSFTNSLGIPGTYNYAPYVNGTETNQADFAEFSLNATRNAGGSGYSWWQFQDVPWFSPDDKNNVNRNWFGLLRYADPNTNGLYNTADEKPAVAKFQNYLDASGNPPAGNTLSKTSSYYNPYTFPTTSPNTHSGIITDQNGIGIKDAVIIATSEVTHSNGITWPGHYTFTESTGLYHIYPYPDDAAPTIIVDFRISGVGINRGWIQPSATHVDNFMLERSLNFNNTNDVSNVTVVPGDPKVFQAGNTLTANNVIVQPNANADFKARQYVHINTEFYAENGSEVHIYIAETFPECNDFNTYRSPSITNNPNYHETNAEQSAIELKFLLPKNQFGFSIYPNPGSDIFNIEIKDNQSINPLYQIKVINLLGKVVYSATKLIPLFTLDLMDLSKGIYYIQINSKTQKLIIQ